MIQSPVVYVGLALAILVAVYLTLPSREPGIGGPPVETVEPGLSLSLRNGITIDFVEIDAGRFEMGAEEDQEDEQPVRTVQITRGFQLGKYEVTQAQWGAVMGTNPSHFRGANLPVESVSWDDAQEFLGKLNDTWDGYRYRLPTEAQWEYAARAGTTGDYAGDLEAMGWYADNSSERRIDSERIWTSDLDSYRARLEQNKNQTHRVGQKEPNAWGLYDMHGNVSEWVQGWYDEDYYGSRRNPDMDPQGPARGSNHVIRGGSWGSPPLGARVANRFGLEPSDRNGFLGFRVARQVR